MEFYLYTVYELIFSVYLFLDPLRLIGNATLQETTFSTGNPSVFLPVVFMTKKPHFASLLGSDDGPPHHASLVFPQSGGKGRKKCLSVFRCAHSQSWHEKGNEKSSSDSRFSSPRAPHQGMGGQVEEGVGGVTAEEINEGKGALCLVGHMGGG